MSLQARDLHVSYDGTPALVGLSLEVRAGEVLGLVGPNGSGKSTLLGTLAGLVRPERGQVLLDGEPLEERSPRQIARALALLEQAPRLGFDFPVEEVVSWGRLSRRPRLGPWRAEDARAVRWALAVTGLEALRSRPLFTLSGGEQQRAFLAMALAQEPRFLLLDEPTAHLDLKHQLDLLARVRELTRRGLGAAIALHDLNLAARFADRLLVLSRGRAVACGPPAEVLTPALLARVWEVTAAVRPGPDGPWIVPLGDGAAGRAGVCSRERAEARGSRS